MSDNSRPGPFDILVAVLVFEMVPLGFALFIIGWINLFFNYPSIEWFLGSAAASLYIMAGIAYLKG